MTKIYDCHVFAHKDGRYQTTHASTGVTNTERTVLEQFFFGQTNDEQYLASLVQEPGVIWRRVDGRFALTRVLAGKKDANGRATLRFETLVIPVEASGIADNLAELVRSTWRFSREGASSTYSVEARPQELHMDKVSRIVLHFRESKRIVARSTALSLRDVEKIVSLCRNDPAFSLCYKSLNDRAPVAINLVFGDITERQIMTRTTSTQPHPNPEPVRKVPGRSPTTGVFMPIALCLVLLVQIITLFAIPSSSNSSLSDDMQGHIITRIVQTTDEVHASVDEVSKTIEGTSKDLSAKIGRTSQEHSDAISKQASELKSTIHETVNDLKNIASGRDIDMHEAIHTLETRLTSRIDAVGSDLRKELEDALEPLKHGIENLKHSQTNILETVGEIEKSVKSDQNDGRPSERNR